MDFLRLYFTRHGQSEANVLRIMSDRDLPHGLTELGRRQAADLAERLQPVGVRLIYHSTILRAVQTAQILASALKVDMQPAAALREFDCGVLEGRSDDQCWEMHHELWADWMDRGLWERRIEGGENFFDIRDRFMPWLEAMLARERPLGGSLVLVGHAALFISMLPLACVNIDHARVKGLPLHNTDCVIAEARPEGLVCLEWAGEVL